MVEPVIIVGAPRSGTNMLRDVLASLPGMTTWPCDEINFVWKHGNRSTPHDELSPRQANPEARAYIRRAFENQAARGGADMVVEKTCATSLRVAFAAEVLPEARFIFIRRHGIDAAASTAKRWNAPFELGYTARKARFVPVSDVPHYAAAYLRERLRKSRARRDEQSVTSWWGPRPADFKQLQSTFALPDVAMLQWQRCVEASLQDLAHVPRPRQLEVSYEEFVTTPQLGIRRVLDFLGKPEAFDAGAVQAVSPSSIGKAAQSLPPEVRQRLANLAAPTLGRLGYV